MGLGVDLPWLLFWVASWRLKNSQKVQYPTASPPPPPHGWLFGFSESPCPSPPNDYPLGGMDIFWDLTSAGDAIFNETLGDTGYAYIALHAYILYWLKAFGLLFRQSQVELREQIDKLAQGNILSIISFYPLFIVFRPVLYNYVTQM